MVERILEREEKNERRRAQRVLAQGGDEAAVAEPVQPVSAPADEQGLLADSRFARLFQDEDFAVDEASREFQQLNPSTKTAPASNLDHEKGLTAVEEEAIDEVPGSSDEDSTDEDEAGHNRYKTTDRISTADYKRGPNKKQKKRDPMRMQVTSSGSNATSNARGHRDRSFGSQAQGMQPMQRTKRNTGFGGAVGDKVITFEPSTKKSRPRENFDSGSNRVSKYKDRRSASGNTFRRM
jgi:ribosome biogenesis protein ENP2